MSKAVTAAQAARLLLEANDILILTHQYPDGDTLGSGYALCRALLGAGRRARVACADPIPEKYDYMLDGLEEPDFEPAFICAVDVADPKLLGSLRRYEGSIRLCIDHHGSNVQYAEHLLLDAQSTATAMLVADVIRKLGVPVDKPIADCLYTGIATDSGCFKYSNTTAATHRLAAELMDRGADYAAINRSMFDIKSRARVELERLALESMKFYLGGRCAVMVITNDMVEASGAKENDMEGLAPLPRQIEGVWVGVTLRQKADGAFKVSVRTGTHADASAICVKLGGGGHVCAAGCAMAGPAEDAIARILSVVADTVEGIR